jgi:putative intracellular protease/amidase
LAGIQPGPITGRETSDRSGRLLDSIDPMAFDALVVPGGAEGNAPTGRPSGVLRAARDLHAAGRRVAAICAAPLVLQAAEFSTAAAPPAIRRDRATDRSLANG